jgi:hypothetical protein
MSLSGLVRPRDYDTAVSWIDPDALTEFHRSITDFARVMQEGYTEEELEQQAGDWLAFFSERSWINSARGRRIRPWRERWRGSTRASTPWIS